MLKINHYLLAGTALAFALGVSAPVALHAQQQNSNPAPAGASQPAMNKEQTGMPSASGAQGSAPHANTGNTTQGTGQSAGQGTGGSATMQSQAGQSGATNQLAAEGKKLVGKDLYGANNEKVGEVDNVVMGPNNQANSVLVDIGGFLGMGAKTVAIPVSQLRAEGDRLVAQNLTKEQAKDMQEYKEGDSTTGQKRM